ncbi:7-cyano-7-deazaguanine synthase [Candidatus Gottesmanbacteria bacterium]|nr:7-cyano-7-deazaguanine synthase [Candidatus Gottesmanbacteria bacterium]
MQFHAQFPHQSLEKLYKKLADRDLEDIDVIRHIESIFIKKRGYVFRKLKPGTRVVFQISGGIDSVITASILMKRFGLVLYPLFLRRGQSRVKQEEASVDYFSKIFVKQFPNHFYPVFKMETRIPPFEIRATLIANSNNKVVSGSERRWGIPMYASLLTSYAVEYAYYLEEEHNLKIRTILCAAIESDSIQMAHHSLTGLRGIMLNICTQTNDYRWQFTSPWIEKELGYYVAKKDLIRWGWLQHLPIHRSWSCYLKGIFHCGRCNGCWSRKQAFIDAKVVDRTQYRDTMTDIDILKSICFSFLDTKS